MLINLQVELSVSEVIEALDNILTLNNGEPYLSDGNGKCLLLEGYDEDDEVVGDSELYESVKTRLKDYTKNKLPSELRSDVGNPEINFSQNVVNRSLWHRYIATGVTLSYEIEDKYEKKDD